MANVLFRRNTKANIENTSTSPIIDGQILYTTDQPNGQNIIYADVGSERVQLAGNIVDEILDTESKNPVQNLIVANAINDMQNQIAGLSIKQHHFTITPSDPNVVDSTYPADVFYPANNKKGLVVYCAKTHLNFVKDTQTQISLGIPGAVKFDTVYAIADVHTTVPNHKTIGILQSGVSTEHSYAVYTYTTGDSGSAYCIMIFVGYGNVDESAF